MTYIVGDEMLVIFVYFISFLIQKCLDQNF